MLKFRKFNVLNLLFQNLKNDFLIEFTVKIYFRAKLSILAALVLFSHLFKSHK